jgi:hypothetical protein
MRLEVSVLRLAIEFRRAREADAVIRVFCSNRYRLYAVRMYVSSRSELFEQWPRLWFLDFHSLRAAFDLQCQAHGNHGWTAI